MSRKEKKKNVENTYPSVANVLFNDGEGCLHYVKKKKAIGRSGWPRERMHKKID
jgi:hypothetical protein